MNRTAKSSGAGVFDIFAVYKKLLKIYGPQKWWPVLNRRDPYFEIAVGAILTQSAAWKNVAKAINNLYSAKALTAQKIIKLGSRRLASLIRPAGYFRQKTKKLMIFSKWLIKNYGGDITHLKHYKLLTTRHQLLQLWGIGPETADSIILYALNKPIFVIDEYTRRLCKKFGVEFKTYDEYQKFFESSLFPLSPPKAGRQGERKGVCRPLTTTLFQEFHALIVASGKDKHRNL